jgi:hypothetical protein
VSAGKYLKRKYGNLPAFIQVLRFDEPALFQMTNRKTLKADKT